MDNNYFDEEQRFTQMWVQVVLYSLWAVFFVVGIALVMTKKTGLIIAMGLFVLITIFVLGFKSLKLQVSIGVEAITYRFFPVQWKYRKIKIDNIETIQVVEYDPIADYGGWGIRVGRDGMAYTVKGNHGMYIRQVGKSPILIGTSKPSELQRFLENHNLT